MELVGLALMAHRSVFIPHRVFGRLELAGSTLTLTLAGRLAAFISAMEVVLPPAQVSTPAATSAWGRQVQQILVALGELLMFKEALAHKLYAAIVTTPPSLPVYLLTAEQLMLRQLAQKEQLLKLHLGLVVERRCASTPAATSASG